MHGTSSNWSTHRFDRPELERDFQEATRPLAAGLRRSCTGWTQPEQGTVRKDRAEAGWQEREEQAREIPWAKARGRLILAKLQKGAEKACILSEPVAICARPQQPNA